MKSFIKWLLAIITGLIIIDFTIGFIFEKWTESHPMKGDYRQTNYLFNEFNEDVLILGSSVGLNSINVSILQDSLGISAYSGASNGQTFPYFLTMLKAVITGPSTPKVILLGILDNNLKDEGLGKRYTFLAPYYGKNISDIDSILNNAQKLNKLFLKSNLYKLNTAWFRILLYYFKEPGLKGENGFIAKPIPLIFPSKDPPSEGNITDERKNQLREFAHLCQENDIKLIVFLPPRYIENVSDSIPNEILDIITEYGGELWNDTFMSPFKMDSTLFYDSQHVNVNGSVIYTDSVIKRLKDII